MYTDVHYIVCTYLYTNIWWEHDAYDKNNNTYADNDTQDNYIHDKNDNNVNNDNGSDSDDNDNIDNSFNASNHYRNDNYYDIYSW